VKTIPYVDPEMVVSWAWFFWDAEEKPGQQQGSASSRESLADLLQGETSERKFS
jgi:hypothetical protein